MNSKLSFVSATLAERGEDDLARLTKKVEVLRTARRLVPLALDEIYHSRGIAHLILFILPPTSLWGNALLWYVLSSHRNSRIKRIVRILEEEYGWDGKTMTPKIKRKLAELLQDLPQNLQDDIYHSIRNKVARRTASLITAKK